MLVDQAVLLREKGRWTTKELPVVTVPPTIKALIGARIDRLTADERAVLELASIEGREFARSTLAQLTPERLSSELGSLLDVLVRKELIREATPDGEAFDFRHGLIRDVTYESMPKRTRADLHERFADLAGARRRSPESDEVIGFHLERACRYRLELGDADDRTRTLAAAAAKRLGAAARHAAARRDEKAAASLRERADALADVAAER